MFNAMKNLIRRDVIENLLKETYLQVGGDQDFVKSLSENSIGDAVAMACSKFRETMLDKLAQTAPFSVLIIDDDSMKTDALMAALKKIGISRIVTVDNLADAEDIVNRSLRNMSPFDMILLDMQFPRSTSDAAVIVNAGKAFLGYMRHADIRIPVLICSSEDVHDIDALKRHNMSLMGNIICDGIFEDYSENLKTYVCQAIESGYGI